MKSPHHTFNIEIAIKYGLEEAVLIHHFQYWTAYNRRLKRNFKEGKTWTYQSREEIGAHFPYFTEKQIRTITDRLIEKKVLIKKNFNRTPFDRTLWYAFVNEDDFLNKDYESPNGQIVCPNGQMDLDDRANGFVETGNSIAHTDTHPETNTVCNPTPVGADVKESFKKEIIQEALELPKELVKKDFSGNEVIVRLQDIFLSLTRSKKDFSTKEIHQAWKILRDYSGPIRDPVHFIEGTIKNLLKEKKAKHLNQNQPSWEEKCQKDQMHKRLEESNVNSSASDMEERISLGSLLKQEFPDRF